MAWIGTMPGSTDLAPGQAARRKPTDDGWEGYHMVTAEEMAAKADLNSLADVAFSGSYNDLLDKPEPLSVNPQRIYVGTTDGSGNYTVTYDTPLDEVPAVFVELQGASANQWARVVSSNASGFTIQAVQRNTVNLLGMEVLLGATVSLSGASVAVLVVER